MRKTPTDMQRLAERTARLLKLEGLNAPDPIIHLAIFQITKFPGYAEYATRRAMEGEIE